MSTGGNGFVLIWIIALAIFFALLAAFEVWYKNYDGFWDWWYSEINRSPEDRRRRLGDK